jgi:hypothetical protein
VRTVGRVGRTSILILQVQMHSRCDQPCTKHECKRDDVTTLRLQGHAGVSDRSRHCIKVLRWLYRLVKVISDAIRVNADKFVSRVTRP